MSKWLEKQLAAAASNRAVRLGALLLVVLLSDVGLLSDAVRQQLAAALRSCASS